MLKYSSLEFFRRSKKRSILRKKTFKTRDLLVYRVCKFSKPQAVFFRKSWFLRTSYIVNSSRFLVLDGHKPSISGFDKFLRLFTIDSVDTYSTNRLNPASTNRFIRGRFILSLSYILVIVHLTERFFSINGFSGNSFFYFTEDNPTLHLNYKRRNFFPFLFSSERSVLLFSSLGLFSRMFLKPKSFIRNKAVYLLTSSFLRKVLIYSNIKHFELYVNRKPLYLQECIRLLFNPSIAPYKHPFSNDFVLERFYKNPFWIPNIYFVNNKNFSYQKTRLRGRIKRRISKRLIKANNVLD